MASYIKLIHNGIMKTVALYEGIEQGEFTSLLSTVFNINGSIVGVMGEKGLVVPLSLVCKAPQVVPDSVCKLLVLNQHMNTPSAQNDNASQQLPASVTSDAAIAAGEDFSQMVSEDDSVEYVTQEIKRFINGLKQQKFLSPIQHHRLSEMLVENSNLLFAAYSVAISANDSEYFAEICKDISNSLATDQGKIACEAQDEVLQICDQLYINDKITENQLLYLRHLILIREEAVATLYDEFQEHQNVSILAKALYELANTHPFQSLDQGEDEEEEEEEDDEDDEDGEDNDGSPEVPVRRNSSSISKGLTGVIALMSRSGVISKTEANVLYEMVEQENDYVIAAYELYEKDKNLDELQDTLIRCVRLEIRKRVTDIQEKELAAMQNDRRGVESDDDDDDIANVVVEDVESDTDSSEEDEEEGAEDSADSEKDSGDDEFKLEDIQCSTILASLNIDNIWHKTVPEEFIKTVFIGVVRKQLELEQAKSLCDLFHAKYDLVHSAWEVFTVQKDVVDFLDTLRRIVRDVKIESIREAVTEEMKSPKPSRSSVPAESKPAPSAPASALNTTATSASNHSSNEMPLDQKTLQNRKNEALLAVTAAKRELLKHSLEMMVKQGLTSAEKATDLYGRYLAGDIMVDAAIEAYASDRDVGEFLDTLQVLANNSKEDLEVLMRAVSNENEEEESGGKSAQEVAFESIALNQITEIVSEMLKNDMIGPGIAEAFKTLIKNRDQRLIDAYNTYQANKSGAELVNSLLKIVIASVEETPKAETSKTETPEASKKSPSKPNPAKSEDDAQQSALDPSDQKTVVEILMRARAIDEEQYIALSKLIDEGNTEIARVFLNYEENKDVYALIDSLKAMDIKGLANSPSSSSSEAQEVEEADEDEEEDGAEDDGDDDDYEQDFDEDDGAGVEEKFMEIIQGMKLSDLETAALRLAIAENDPAIRNAIDRFRADVNETALMNAMRDAARSVIQRTLSTRMGRAFEKGGDEYERNEDEDEEKEGEDEDQEDDEKDGEEDENEDDDDEIDGDEDNDEEEDETNDQGNSLILSQTARDHVFPILIQELIKESIISRNDGKIILQEFAAGNPVISAALDVYDRDNDMAQLVESLQQMVENVNSN